MEQSIFFLRFPHFLILTIVASLLLLEEGGEGNLLLLKGGEVLEGSRLSAHGTAAPQPLRSTASGEPVKGGGRYYGGQWWRRMTSVFQQE